MYIELRERNAGNMEIAAFNQQAFRDFMGEDSKRTFLGLDERDEWRRLTAKEARGKLAQCSFEMSGGNEISVAGVVKKEQPQKDEPQSNERGQNDS